MSLFLVSERKVFANEIKDLELRRLIAASTNAEVGGQGNIADQCYLETMFNRGAARKKSLNATITDGAYYPDTTINKLGKPVAAARQATIDKIIDEIMSGANRSNVATGNESGLVHSGGAEVTVDLGPGKERFVREKPDLLWIGKALAAIAKSSTIG